MAKGKKQKLSPQETVTALGDRKNLNKGDANRLIKAQLALQKLEAEAAVPVAVSNTTPSVDQPSESLFGLDVTQSELKSMEETVNLSGAFDAFCDAVMAPGTDELALEVDPSVTPVKTTIPSHLDAPLASPRLTYANGVVDPQPMGDLADERPIVTEVDTLDEHATEAEPEWEPAANTTLPLQGGDVAVVAGHTDEQLFNALSVFIDGNQPQDVRGIAFALLASTFTHPKAMLEHPVAAQLFFAHVLKSVETLAEQESKDDPSSLDLRATVISMFGKRTTRVGLVCRSLGLPESTDNDNFSSDFLQLVCQDLKNHSLVRTPLRTAQVDNENKTPKYKSLLGAMTPDGTIHLVVKFVIDALTQLTPLAMEFANTDESRAALAVRMSIQLTALEAAWLAYESHKGKPKGRKSMSYVTMIIAKYCDPDVTLVETGEAVRELAVWRTQLVTAITGALVAILGRDNLSEQMQAEIVSNFLGAPSPMAEIQGLILSQKEVKGELHGFAQVFAPATDGATVFFSAIESAFSKFAKFLGNANLGDDVAAIARACMEADDETQADRLRYAFSVAQQKLKEDSAEAVIAEGEPVADSQQPKKKKVARTRVKSGGNGNKLNDFVVRKLAGTAGNPVEITDPDSDDEPIVPKKRSKKSTQSAELTDKQPTQSAELTDKQPTQSTDQIQGLTPADSPEPFCQEEEDERKRQNDAQYATSDAKRRRTNVS